MHKRRRNGSGQLGKGPGDRSIRNDLPDVNSAQQPQDPLVGKLLGSQFFIEKVIGEGGMGKVYCATDQQNSMKVAIKTMRKEIAENNEMFRRFRREIRNASRIDHPNVAKTINFRMADIPFLIMEYVEGRTLNDIVADGGSLPWERVGKIAIQVCRALKAAHTIKPLGLVHRDIKLGNIMLMENDFVKVLDFGLAKSFAEEEGAPGGGLPNSPETVIPPRVVEQLTRCDDVFGTPSTMPPEQAKGEECDYRADTYALGCVMYRLLCGSFPFLGETEVEIMGKQVEEPVESLSKRAPHRGIPGSLEKIVLYSLEKKKEDRFQSAAEFEEALVDVMTALGCDMKDIPKAPKRAARPQPQKRTAPQDLTTHIIGGELKEAERYLPSTEGQAKDGETEAVEDIDSFEEYEEEPRKTFGSKGWGAVKMAAFVALIVAFISTAATIILYNVRDRLPPDLRRAVVKVVNKARNIAGDAIEEGRDIMKQADDYLSDEKVKYTINTWPGEASVLLLTDGKEEPIGKTDRLGRLEIELPEGKHVLVIRRGPDEREVPVSPKRTVVNVTFTGQLESSEKPLQPEERGQDELEIDVGGPGAMPPKPGLDLDMPLDDAGSEKDIEDLELDE